MDKIKNFSNFITNSYQKIDEDLNEWTSYNFSGKELIKDTRVPIDDEGEEIFKEFFPIGYESLNKAKEDLNKSDESYIRKKLNPPMFVHTQYHEFTDKHGEKYRAHQSQYYNSNYKETGPDFNPGVTALTLIKIPREPNEKEKTLGTFLVKTDEYIKDLSNLDIIKRVT